MRAWIVAGFLALASASSAQAQTNSDELVVTGERLREMVRSFVDEVAPPELSEDQLARWNSRYCPLLAGLPARPAQYLVDRMSQRAFELGLRPGDENCRPNVLVFVTPDAGVLAQALADDHDLMAYYNNGEYGNSLGRDALLEFVSSTAPVRWWHVAQTVDQRGGIIDGDGDVVVADGTRLHRATRQDFNRVMVIVDARQADGLRLEALADYLAMVTLAQLDARASVADLPTILNVFADRDLGRPGPTQLTDWDRAYLEGLYRAPRNANNTGTQERAIARRMEGELREDPRE